MAPAFAVNNFVEGFALLFALAEGGNGVAEGDDGEDVDFGGDAEDGVDVWEVAKADPVGADTRSPCGEDHGLDGSAAIGDTEGALMFDANDDGQGGLGDIGA